MEGETRSIGRLSRWYEKKLKYLSTEVCLWALRVALTLLTRPSTSGRRRCHGHFSRQPVACTGDRPHSPIYIAQDFMEYGQESKPVISCQLDNHKDDGCISHRSVYDCTHTSLVNLTICRACAPLSISSLYIHANHFAKTR